VSDFLGRLAARAVGHVSTAQPRLPARFEDGLGGADDEGLEVVETEVAAAPAHGSRAAMDVRSRRSRGSDAGQDTAAAQRSGIPIEGGLSRHEAVQPAEPSSPVAPVMVVDTVMRASSPFGPAPADADSVLEAIRTEVSPLVAASVVTTHVAEEVLRTSRPDELGRSSGVGAPEPPVVRVHIGRLEIRASLPESQPSRPAPIRESGTNTVSLSAYLRGSR